MRKFRQIGCLLLVLALTLTVGFYTAAAEDTAEETGSEAYNGYIVKLKDNTGIRLFSDSDAEYLGMDLYAVDTVADAYSLAGADAVEYIEPNYQLQFFDEITDPIYANGYQWYLNGAYGMAVEEVWEQNITGNDVTVAVLDSGLYAAHTDFNQSKILPGYNATDQSSNINDIMGHGTEVSGVIAASRNGTGIVGAAYGVNLLPICVANDSSNIYIKYVIAGIDYAIKQNVNVINMSLGTATYSPSLNEAVQAALNAGIIVVASAGNDGNETKNYPAACAGVIGVGAIDSEGMVADYSQKNDSVWVSAPGSGILTLYFEQDDLYVSASGTSFSSPCVAALAALAKEYANQKEQTLTPSQFAWLLQTTAEDRGDTGYDTSYGYGTVSAPAILAAMEKKQVQYVLNGGTLPEGALTEYIPYYEEEILLPVPEREGYFFGGWFEKEDFSGEKVTAFRPTEFYGDHVYYAKWIEDRTALSAVTFGNWAAEQQDDGSWLVYLPVGTEIPESTEAAAAEFIYTGEDYTLSYRVSHSTDNSNLWIITAVQTDQLKDSYTHDYTLWLDNTTYYAPALTGTDIVTGTAIPASLDGTTGAKAFETDVAGWFTDEDSRTLEYALSDYKIDGEPQEEIKGLVFSEDRVTYTPDGSQAKQTVSFAVTASDGRFSSPPVNVSIAVGARAMSIPVLSATQGKYDGTAPSEVKLGYRAYDNTFLSVLDEEGNGLTGGTDYLLAESTEGEGEATFPQTLTLTQDYLKMLPNGLHSLTLCFETEAENAENKVIQVSFIVEVENACATGHLWDEGTVTRKATATQSGEKTFICQVCKASKVEEIPATGQSGTAYLGEEEPVQSDPVEPDENTTEPDPMENPFTDVAEETYYYSAILWAVENGITNGVSAHSFAPNASCTRAQMVTFLWRAAGSPEPKSEKCKFADVTDDAYYKKAILWATEQGIVMGVSQTKFAPEETVTRGQAVTFLYRYMGNPEVTEENAFTDIPSNAYYTRPVTWAFSASVTKGTGDTTFSPEDNCLRGQIMTFLYRLMGA